MHWGKYLARLWANNVSIGFAFLGLIILLFIFMPLFEMIIGSSPAILLDTLLDEEVRDSIWLTIYTALIASTVGLLLGVPLAYLLARHNFPGKRVVEGLIDLPIVVPHTAAGIALLFVFGHQFILGRAFHQIGVDFVSGIPGIVIAMLFVSIPFLINSAREGFEKVDVRLEKVARTLGASPWQAFCKVSLPLAWRSILAGTTMMWARGISEFGAVLILTYHPMVAPILVWKRFQEYGLDYARPVAVLLLLVCLVIFVGIRSIAYRGGRA